MKKTILIFLIIAFKVCSTFAQTNNKLAPQYYFKEPSKEFFIAKRPITLGKETFDRVYESKDKKVEIRFVFNENDYILNRSEVAKVTNWYRLFKNKENLTEETVPKIYTLDTAALSKAYKCNAGFNCMFVPTTEFGGGYKLCLAVMLFKHQWGCVTFYLLANDSADLRNKKYLDAVSSDVVRFKNKNKLTLPSAAERIEITQKDIVAAQKYDGRYFNVFGFYLGMSRAELRYRLNTFKDDFIVSTVLGDSTKPGFSWDKDMLWYSIYKKDKITGKKGDELFEIHCSENSNIVDNIYIHSAMKQQIIGNTQLLFTDEIYNTNSSIRKNFTGSIKEYGDATKNYWELEFNDKYMDFIRTAKASSFDYKVKLFIHYDWDE